MEIRLRPDQEANLAAIAADTGRSTDELVQEAVSLWERQAQHRRQAQKPKRTRAEAAAHLLELRKGTRLPEGETIKDLISYGRA